MAPEVLNNKYNEKCDLWSAGVIMYVLLCGSLPFYGTNDEEIYENIKKGKFSMDFGVWKDISDDAKDLIKQLLVKDYNKRLSADQALNHKWIKNMKENFGVKQISNEKLAKIVENIRSFSTSQKLQQATLAYIVHNLTNKGDVDEIRKVFTEFDENGDGKLTREELVKGLSRVLSQEDAEFEVFRIIDMIDADGNGFIEFEEFMQCELHKDKILTDENLITVFNLFDKDKSGAISPSEIQAVLGGDSDISENVWKDIMKGLDENGDGEIEFKEFKQMMNLIMNKSTKNLGSKTETG